MYIEQYIRLESRPDGTVQWGLKRWKIHREVGKSSKYVENNCSAIFFSQRGYYYKAGWGKILEVLLRFLSEHWF
jgi:hypothetical protein